METVEIKGIPEKTPEWFEARRGLVTASDVPAIMGVNPWCTARDVFLRKIHGTEFQGNANTERGKLLEPVIFDRYADGHDDLVRSPGLFVRGHLGASPDAYHAAGRVPVEIKAPRSLSRLEDKTDLYRWQVICQAWVLGGDRRGVLVYGNTRRNVVEELTFSAEEMAVMEYRTAEFADCLRSGILSLDFW